MFRLSFCKNSPSPALVKIFQTSFMDSPFTGPLLNIQNYEKKKKLWIYNKGRSFMAIHCISQSVKFLGPHLPSSWQHIPIKDTFLSVSLLCPFLSLFCFHFVAQDVWSEWRWEVGPVRDGEVMCNLTCFCSLHIACRCSFTVNGFE